MIIEVEKVKVGRNFMGGGVGRKQNLVFNNKYDQILYNTYFSGHFATKIVNFLLYY